MADLAQFLKLQPNIYEQTICKYLAKDHGRTALSKLARGSVIACTARSGSSLVQVCLEHYGAQSQEWLNTEGEIRRAFDAGKAKTLREYADYLAAEAKGDRLDIKGPLPVLLFLYQMHEVPERKARWRFVFLRRKNLVEQAISSRIAAKTGRWTSGMPAHEEVTDDDYSFDEIMKGVQGFANVNEQWERAFALLDIEPLRLYYEDFCKDMATHTWRIAKFIGLETPDKPLPIQPRIERQATDLNSRWETRFRDELGNLIRSR